MFVCELHASKECGTHPRHFCSTGKGISKHSPSRRRSQWLRAESQFSCPTTPAPPRSRTRAAPCIGWARERWTSWCTARHSGPWPTRARPPFFPRCIVWAEPPTRACSRAQLGCSSLERCALTVHSARWAGGVRAGGCSPREKEPATPSRTWAAKGKRRWGKVKWSCVKVAPLRTERNTLGELWQYHLSFFLRVPPTNAYFWQDTNESRLEKEVFKRTKQAHSI